jgi:hypothetical protein
MAGINRFNSVRVVKEKVASTTKPCVFISHRSRDKEAARIVATEICKYDLDVYLDERDEKLQQAVATSHDEGIAYCIEDGLNNSTALLGILGPETFGSWWVPYEIGGAHGRRIEVAHLVHKDVREVPSYVKIAKVLLDTYDFHDWVQELRPVPLSEGQKAIRKFASSRRLGEILPEFRFF